MSEQFPILIFHDTQMTQIMWWTFWKYQLQHLEVRVHGKSVEEDRMSVLASEGVMLCPSHSSMIKGFVWCKFQVASKTDLARPEPRHYKVLELPNQQCVFNQP